MVKKKVLILGSSGFLGQYLSIALKDNFKLFLSHNKQKCKIIDITKEKKLFDFLKKKKIDIILNLTGQINKNYLKFKKVSISGNKNLINFAKDNNILNIFFSSDQVYGSSNHIFNEKSKLKPILNYGKIKKRVESMYIKSQTNFLIIRISNVYDTNFKKRGFLNNLANYFETKNNLFILNHSDLLRNFIHIDDFCIIIKNLLLIKKNQHKILNVSHQNLYLIKIIKMLESSYKKKISIIIKNKKIIPLKIEVDNKLIIKILKYKFKKDLKECLIQN